MLADASFSSPVVDFIPTRAQATWWIVFVIISMFLLNRFNSIFKSILFATILGDRIYLPASLLCFEDRHHRAKRNQITYGVGYSGGKKDRWNSRYTWKQSTIEGKMIRKREASIRLKWYWGHQSFLDDRKTNWTVPDFELNCVLALCSSWLCLCIVFNSMQIMFVRSLYSIYI